MSIIPHLLERTRFDILVRNLLSQETNYRPVEQNLKLSHPLDVYHSTEGLTFEIACTGADKKDLEILIEGQHLQVNYNNKSNSPEDEELEETIKLEYIYRGIAKRSFNYGWKIDPKYDLSKAESKLDKGLLSIFIPFTEGKKAKSLKIK